jgi:hypothetical protein
MRYEILIPILKEGTPLHIVQLRDSFFTLTQIFALQKLLLYWNR